VHGVVAADRSHAVFACTRLSSGPSLHTSPIRLVGLADDTSYDLARLSVGHPSDDIACRQPSWLATGLRMTGRQLAAVGFNAPVLMPETSMLIEIAAVGKAQTASATAR